MQFIKKPALLLAFCFFAGAAFLHAQPAANEIEALLATNAVTWAQASRFVLEASDLMAISDTEEAFSYAAENNLLPKKVSANDAARLDAIALFLMRSFNISGGIFYSITKAPHYAYRELVYREIIQGRADPAMLVTGEQLLFITGRILAMREAKDAADAEQASVNNNIGELN